jgi:hypothetical protein
MTYAGAFFIRSSFPDPTGFYTGKTEWVIMIKRTTTISITVILVIFLLVLPAMAAVTTISQGNTVFIGEEGLDVSSAVGVDNQIGWWASGAPVSTASPDSTFSFGGSKTSFAVTPTTFGSYPGTWYRLDPSTKANGTAFYVADPILNLRVEDKTVGVDVTQNKWVYRGDEIGFRIETNLNTINSQRGTAATIAIKVQSPDGGVYSALVDSAGTAHQIDNIAVTTSPQDTGALWDTGRSTYSPGTYTIWAECNTNRMKDNYGVTGKTVSTQTSMLNTEFNPIIGVNVPTTNPTTVTTTIPTAAITTKPTTVPATVVLTTTPTAAATTMPETSATTLPAPVTTTPKKSPGFGIPIIAVSLTLIAALFLKKSS